MGIVTVSRLTERKGLAVFALVGISLFAASEFARAAVSATAPVEAAQDCESALEGLQNLGITWWNLDQPWGRRGAISPRPKPNSQIEPLASALSIHYWGQSIGVARTIEEARAHDASYKGSNLSKIPYLITNISVDDFPRVSPTDNAAEAAEQEQITPAVQRRFAQILAAPETQIIEFEDAFNNKGKKIPAENYVTLDKQVLKDMDVVNDVFWFAKDSRGPRFHFYTWTLPQVKGIVAFDQILKKNASGAIADEKIRKSMRELRAFLEEGGTMSFNTNFNEALDFARDQWRVGGDGTTMVQNSRYHSDPEVYKAAQRAYAEGRALSLEAREADGRLVAGEIMFKEGTNVVKGDTVFHMIRGQHPLFPDRNYANIMKAASVAEAIRLKRVGINFLDIGMVTPMTEQCGGVVIPLNTFRDMVHELNSRPPIDFELGKPITLQEIDEVMGSI